MKYLRRYPRSEKQELNNWHEVDEKTALQSVKLGVPRSEWHRIQKWFEDGVILSNAFAFYKKVPA